MTTATMQPPTSSAPAAKPWYKREFFIGRAVEAEEVMNFSRQAASFLRSGIPIIDALGVVAEETSSKKMREVLAELQRKLRGGMSFGDAIAEYTKVFPGYYIAVVRAAELTGQLDDAMEQLSGYIERDLAARRQVKSSLTYPSIVMVLAIVAVIVMSTWVLPKFKSFYTGLGARLPLPTRMLLNFTNFVGTWWYVIVGSVVAVAVITFVVLGGKHGKARRDAFLLRLPAIGPLVHLIAVERFCRVLATLTHAGVSLPTAVQVSADSTNNRVFQTKVAEARELMMRGGGLARPIADTGIFPAAARQMIRVGESTGSLDEQLRSAAIFYERELNYRLKKVTDYFEPAVILLVGGVVGFIAVAQISAMYSVYHQIHT